MSRVRRVRLNVRVRVRVRVRVKVGVRAKVRVRVRVMNGIADFDIGRTLLRWTCWHLRLQILDVLPAAT